MFFLRVHLFHCSVVFLYNCFIFSLVSSYFHRSFFTTIKAKQNGEGEESAKKNGCQRLASRKTIDVFASVL